ncbi:sodium:solute symporter family protein [Spongorhabdus nitratireducens]
MSIIIIFSLAALLLVYSILQIKQVGNFSAFALDRNAFGVVAIYCTFLASGIGAGHLMGAAEKSYATGWYYTIGCLGYPLQLLLVAWLAPRVYQWRQCLSSGEILSKAYGGNDIRLIAGLIWLFFCTGIISAQVVAMQRVSHMLIPQHETLIAVLLTATVIIYSCLGGVRSVVSTDIFQAWALLLAIATLLVWGIEETGGIESFTQYNLELIQSLKQESSPELLILFLCFLFGDVLIPVSIQRITMARSATQARSALLLTAFVVFWVVLTSGALGTIAQMLDGSRHASETFNIIILFAPDWLGIFLFAGFLAAVMSSCDSYLNTAAVAFSNDILPVACHRLTDRQQLIFGRLATIIIGVGAISIAYYVNDILDILLNTFEAWAPTLFPPLLLTLFYHKLPKRFFYIPFISGLAGLLIWRSVFAQTSWQSAALLIGAALNSCTIWILLRLNSNHLPKYLFGFRKDLHMPD